MDIPALASKNVDKAFKLMSSLAKSATVHLKENATFNFGTAEASSSDTPLTVKLIVVSTKISKELIKKQILVDKIEGLDAYDHINFDGEDWIIADTIFEGVASQMLEIQHG